MNGEPGHAGGAFCEFLAIKSRRGESGRREHPLVPVNPETHGNTG
jgi:hypothetical protein